MISLKESLERSPHFSLANTDNFITINVLEKQRKELQRLEDQAATLILAGYKPEDLVLIDEQGKPSRVVNDPKVAKRHRTLAAMKEAKEKMSKVASEIQAIKVACDHEITQLRSFGDVIHKCVWCEWVRDGGNS